MPKSDANIKVGADTAAFSKAIDGLEKGVTEKLEKIGNVFMGALGLKAASQNIAGALSAFTQPAAELGNVATSLGGGNGECGGGRAHGAGAPGRKRGNVGQGRGVPDKVIYELRSRIYLPLRGSG